MGLVQSLVRCVDRSLMNCLDYRQHPYLGPDIHGNAFGPPGALLDSGTTVILRGLTSAAHFNGREGTVLAFEPVSGRYSVQLPGETLSVRGANLLPSVAVTIVDLESRPALNGCVGHIVGADERYHVSIRGSVYAVNPANVVLPRGSQVWVAGLQADGHYNGMPGLITEVDLAARRYVLQMSHDHLLKVRFEHTRL
jgi:hypothetical protein